VNVDQAGSQPFVEALLDREPNRLGVAFRKMLYRQTRGNPLFTVELLRRLQEGGNLAQDPEGCWVEGRALDWDSLPPRVEAVIEERVGRLEPQLHEILSVASVEGEVFTAGVLARVRAADEGEVVAHLSGDLGKRHGLVHAQGALRVDNQRLSQYRFHHILFQRYLYNMDEVERVHLHEAVGNALEALHQHQAEGSAASAATEASAVQLAWHFEKAGNAHKAVHYLRVAGERAVQLSAYEDGLTHLTKASALLTALPDSPERARLELPLRLALGIACIGRQAYGPQGENAYDRARQLCLEMGEVTQLCLVLGRLSMFHLLRAEHQRARELADEALSLAQAAKDPLHVALGHRLMGTILFSLGEYLAARSHFDQMISFYQPEQHHGSLVRLRGSDAGTSALAYDACCLWCLGYPEQAGKRSDEVLALARELGHPFSLADVVRYAGGMLNSMRREPQALKRHAEESIRLASDKVPGWTGTGTFFRGEALAELGRVQEGIAYMREGMAAYRARGAHIYRPGRLRAPAEAQAASGHPEEGLRTLAEALAVVEETGERHWEAELHRVRAELLLAHGDEAEAETSLMKAIEVARCQSARSWELRASTSLARLWQKQGRTRDARELLAPVYGWFTEGFDTRDLIEARALLDGLC
jgi:predicted ATPase